MPASWRRPHHCIVLGAAVGLSGGLPFDAALTAAYLSVSGPATAAVRLLGLDPLAVNASVAALGQDIHEVAERAAMMAAWRPADLPAPGAPGLDFLAEAHRHKEVRLFAS
jgi:urease accessory protein